MLMNAIRSPWFQLGAHLALMGIGIAIAARGDIVGYLLVLFSGISICADVVILRRRRAQRLLEQDPSAEV